VALSLGQLAELYEGTDYESDMYAQVAVSAQGDWQCCQAGYVDLVVNEAADEEYYELYKTVQCTKTRADGWWE